MKSQLVLAVFLVGVRAAFGQSDRLRSVSAPASAPQANRPVRATVLPAEFGWSVKRNQVHRGAAADFRWCWEENGRGFLVPQNGAIAAVTTATDFAAIDRDFILRQELSPAKIPVRGRGGLLGTIVVFKTAEGIPGKLRFIGYRGTHDYSFPEAAAIPQQVKEGCLARPESMDHLEVKWVLLEEPNAEKAPTAAEKSPTAEQDSILVGPPKRLKPSAPGAPDKLSTRATDHVVPAEPSKERRTPPPPRNVTLSVQIVQSSPREGTTTGLSGAQVSVVGAAGPVGAGSSDAMGRYSIQVPPGSYQVSATANGFQSAVARVTVGNEGAQHTLLLRGTARMDTPRITPQDRKTRRTPTPQNPDEVKPNPRNRR